MIDAHVHLWSLARPEVTWPTPDLAAIHRDFALADYRAAIAGSGIDGAMLVQSQEDPADTDWLLAIAGGDPLVRGVIGWTDLSAPDAPARIAALARRPLLKGFRPMLQGLADPDRIARPDVAPALEAMAAEGLAFDALVRPAQLPAIATIARRHPALRIVIDHAAKPPVAHGWDAEWADAIAACARLPNVHAKLSGLWTELAPGQQRAAADPVARHLHRCFGADRLIWGSDWPVLTLAGSLADWLATARDAIPPDAHARVFGENARRVYRL